MPRPKSPPRLYLDPERRTWRIRDGSLSVRTGCGEAERAEAEKRLSEYLGEKHKPAPSPSPLIVEMLAAYSDEVACSFPNKRRRTSVASSMKFLLDWWADKRASDISPKSCRSYLSKRTPSGGVADLKVLKAATVYWHREYGPLSFMPEFWRPAPSEPKDRWLTRDEAARLLRAAKPYQHLRRAILLGLYTGSRPGVILALRWEQVDLASGTMARKLPGASLSKKRAPKVRLGRRIISHLKRWKRIDGHLCPFVCHYDGKQVVDPHTSWRKVIKRSRLTGITRHTWRHTRATWLMQNGIDLWEAAGHLGMSTKTLERVYGHHDPRHQERAANV